MPRRREITGEKRKELEAARKANRDKNVENRLKALVMRADGESNKASGKCARREKRGQYLHNSVFVTRRGNDAD